jgi:hypothetical protein
MMDLSNLGKQMAGDQPVDMSQSKPILCSECENDMFMQAMKFRKVPKLLAGTAEDQIVPVQVFMCTACGNVNKEFDLNVGA